MVNSIIKSRKSEVVEEVNLGELIEESDAMVGELSESFKTYEYKCPEYGITLDLKISICLRCRCFGHEKDEGDSRIAQDEDTKEIDQFSNVSRDEGEQNTSSRYGQKICICGDPHCRLLILDSQLA